MNKRTFCFLLLFTVVIGGCSTKDNPWESMRDTELTRCGVKTSTSYSGFMVTQEMIPGILKSYLDLKLFTTIDRFSMIVISEGGNNLIYVVNFDEGGWVLISGIQISGESPILGFWINGLYDPDAIRSPEAAFWLEATKQTIAGLFNTSIPL